MAAAIRIDPPLENAGDPAGSHFLLEPRQRDAKAFGDDRRIDLNDTIAEFDRFHAAPTASLPFVDLPPINLPPINLPLGRAG